MDINVLASSSKGNCYRVSDGVTSLLLEAGISIKQIKQGLGFNLTGIDGVLVSHEHKDHCKAVKDIIKCGIDVYASKGTIGAMDIISHRIKPVKAKVQFFIGSFAILPFETQHDCAEPLGYLIQSLETGEKLLFATDTYYVRYRFNGLTHIMVECNYSDVILAENIEQSKVSEYLAQRIRKSHFSLHNVKEFLKANDLSKVKEIYLLHLSGDNSEPERFKKEIQELTGKMVFVAGVD